MPPVASTTCEESTASRCPSGRASSTPATRGPAVDEVDQLEALEPADIRSLQGGCARARMTAAPVRSPPAWTMRWRPWPASRPSSGVPSAPRSKVVPRSRSQVIRDAAARSRAPRLSGSHNCAPTRIVSAACRAGESSRPIAAAMPPCARRGRPSPIAPYRNERAAFERERRRESRDATADDDGRRPDEMSTIMA